MDVNFEATVRYRRGAELQGLIGDLVSDGFPVEDAEAAVMRVHRRVVGSDRGRGFRNLTLGVVALVGCGGLYLFARGGGLWLLGAWVGAMVGFLWSYVGVVQIRNAGKDSKLARLSLLGG